MESISMPIDAVHLYYPKEREIYSRMVFTLKMGTTHAMEVIAFWLWLEVDSHVDIIRHIRSFSDDALFKVALDALNFIRTLYLDDLPNLDRFSSNMQPINNFRQKAICGINYYLENVCSKALNDIRKKAEREAEICRMKELAKQMNQNHLDYMTANRPFESGRSVMDLLKNDMVSFSNFSPLGFQEFGVKNRSIDGLYIPHGEGTSRSTGTRREVFEGSTMRGGWMPPNLIDAEKTILANYPFNMFSENGVGTPHFQLEPSRGNMPTFKASFNPNQGLISDDYLTIGRDALPRYYPMVSPSSRSTGYWSQSDPHIPRDERTLFVTFSNGHPLTAEDLYSFFMRHYGDVELVTMHEPNDGTPPLYAHVSFYTLATVLRILNGNTKVKFITKGKHLWARLFIPKSKFKPVV